MERFFDESGGMQLVLHSPFGSRLNRAWGLALRKRFCRKFNFELQAAATEDAIILSLGPTHSFPLAEVYQYLNAKTVRHLLVQALLDAPMFAVRWRWNAGRALAILRFAGGRKVPPQLQRMQAEDLVSLVFPDQLACFENIQGEREIPDHPLVSQTIRDCLTEAMDIDHLEALLARIETGEVRLLARDLREPSPLAQEILNAKPYAFLDDAPLEERRTQAVMSRRWLDPKTAADLGSLDSDAIARVRTEAWPDPLNADELHDALLLTGFLTAEEGAAWTGLFESLVAEGRATVLRPGAAADASPVASGMADMAGAEAPPASPASPLWVAAERLHQFTALFPKATLEPHITSPGTETATRDEALLELCRSRLEALGPVTPDTLAAPLGLPGAAMAAPLAALESEGFVIQGTFTPGVQETEWCDRRLLARIHRYTLNRLRREIEPVSADVFMRYLFRHHGMLPSEQGEGPASLSRVVELLEGFEAAAVAWEGDILPARVKEYDPAWLDALCLSGKILWGRLTVSRSKNGRQVSPLRTTPIAFLDRRRAGDWIRYAAAPSGDDAPLRSSSETVLGYLKTRGASFFPEIAEGTRLLPEQVNEALAELAAAGLVTADGFAGLRALLAAPSRSDTRRRRATAYTIEEAGRWTLFGSGRGVAGEKTRSGGQPGSTMGAAQTAGAVRDAAGSSPDADQSLERIAWALLRRYGIVFKRLLERESCLPPWRIMLRVYHRLEARGEIRGGRFVAGFSGEQFALPEAVGALREIRRARPDDPWVSVSGADPLNLAGILTPGPRVPALPGNRILFKGGDVVAVRVAGEVRMLSVLESGEAWKARKALDRQPYPPRLRVYLGRR
jgi:ATP-dependent Lhr-like helicase